MVKSIYVVLFMFACLASVVAQAQCFDEEAMLTDEPKPDIFVVESTYKTNFIQLEEGYTPEYLYIAVKKGEEQGRFKISIQQGENNKLVTISLRDQKKQGEAGIYYNVNQALNNINFGGEITLTQSKRLRMDGGGTSQMNQSTTIFHNQEVVIFRINLKSVTLEPVFQQFAYFHFPSGDGRGLFNVAFQPSSAGLYLKKDIDKQRSARVGVTAGPNIEFKQKPNQNINSEFLGMVNLKLAVDL